MRYTAPPLYLYPFRIISMTFFCGNTFEQVKILDAGGFSDPERLATIPTILRCMWDTAHNSIEFNRDVLESDMKVELSEELLVCIIHSFCFCFCFFKKEIRILFFGGEVSLCGLFNTSTLRGLKNTNNKDSHFSVSRRKHKIKVGRHFFRQTI